MKNSNRIMNLWLLAITASLSSCSFIEGVFKTGVGVGVFLVVALIVVVVAVISKMGKK